MKWSHLINITDYNTSIQELIDIKFIIEPKIRFKGESGEQATMFFLDPSGNALEFKAFKDDKQIFVT